MFFKASPARAAAIEAKTTKTKSKTKSTSHPNTPSLIACFVTIVLVFFLLKKLFVQSLQRARIPYSPLHLVVALHIIINRLPFSLLPPSSTLSFPPFFSFVVKENKNRCCFCFGCLSLLLFLILMPLLFSQRREKEREKVKQQAIRSTIKAN